MISEETKAYRKQWRQANPDYWKRSYLKHREERIAKACERRKSPSREIQTVSPPQGSTEGGN